MRKLFLSLSIVLAACAKPAVSPESSTKAPEAAEAAGPEDPLEHAFFDIEGEASSLAAFVAHAADTDFIAFGEFHEHPVGARYELELLQGLHAQDRPVALAMEFFEADTQASLDAYLAGEIDEAAFKEQTKRNEAYDTSHRPLIEFCKDKGIPVIAANAPRPLVTGYRKSKLEYAEYLASLSDEERGLLPREHLVPDDEFKERFLAFMGPKRGPSFLPSMALWNDAMAESAADFRAEHPEHRVVLVVGGFHVAKHLGTVTRYTDRRPEDSVLVVMMTDTAPDAFGLAADDVGEGDLVLVVWP